MTKDRSFALAGIYLLRAMQLRCPACGTKPIFIPWHKVRSLHDWFTPLDGCPRCGYAYEREAGYFLISIWAINYGCASILGLILYGLLEWFFELPVWTLMGCVLLPVLLFSVSFARHSKSLFLAFDLFFDPHSKEGGEDGGNKPPAPPQLGGSPAGHQPVKPCEPAGSLR